MDNNNPAEMSNEDLEKDMQQRNSEDADSVNQENVSKSTASEGTLKSPEQDDTTGLKKQRRAPSDNEQDADDAIHHRGGEVHNGSLPDPEELSDWEDQEIDDNKISG